MQEAEALNGGLRSFPALRGSRSCDVLVIGGGFSGLLTACRMAQHGLRTILVEARQLGSGATAACMGMATAQLADAYADAARVSESAAASWADITLRTVAELPMQLAKWGVHGGIRRQRSMLYCARNADRAAFEALVSLQQRLKLPVGFTQDTGDCPVPAAHAAALEDQHLFDPLVLYTELIEAAVRLHVALYEYTPIRSAGKGRALTEDGEITAEYMVAATGYPIENTAGIPPENLRQTVWITRRLSGGIACHHSYSSMHNGVSMAPVQYGMTAAARVGSPGLRSTQKRMVQVARMLDDQLQDWSVLQESAVQCVHAAGGIPLAGPVSRENPRMMVIGGLGVHGLVQAAIASDVITRQITGHQLPESPLLSPIGDFQRHAAPLVNRHPVRLRRAGAVFRRDVPRCPHMGCRMRWNSARQLWECPCHGSSFTANGECRCAPASENAYVAEHMRRR